MLIEKRGPFIDQRVGFLVVRCTKQITAVNDVFQLLQKGHYKS